MHDLDKLAGKLKDLDLLLGRLAAAERRRELIKLIKVPGWTTPAEYILVSSIVDSITAHLQVIDKLETGLLEGSRLVGKQTKTLK
ncbi:MAG TPA: hypothetical protein VLH38_01700 [Patescibacteria group bacterium]|nr:hypothetical protein [Patescibacteria group bacterium]